ncbi:MAG: arsinothricin resistance N-acetyltransferase ArsN1 family B [Chitinophagaceae bacterium]|nr:N-acetyltransferase [Chitinophagaceae bacterium]MCB0740962.1 N-acetyltransferase [Chitinophagaceae bacterium]HQU56457.1 N-acetyltransferase family protein [Chitinophagaceae bacterium]HQV06320.1 N-acetyltransferase family protein [Chitinophagaceae bacterium]
MVKIRLATPADATAILAIYAPYIEQTSLTFEIEVPSVDAFANRIKTYLQSWPWLVSEVDGKIVGYAYASQYRERVAYQWSIECSVYVDEDFHGTGIAKALYTSLFEIVKRQGFNNIYAVINLPNDQSVAFHEKCGFQYFATYEQVGYKLGRWKNVGWWRLIVNEFIDEPPVPVLLKDFNKDFLPDLFLQKEKEVRL